MKLPNLDGAIIEEAKLTGYLLSEENSGGKAGFFLAFGFTLAQWEALRDALYQHAAQHAVTRVLESPHGVKYIIEGELVAPDGRLPLVRVIWIVDSGAEAPRLITAYPIERSNT